MRNPSRAPRFLMYLFACAAAFFLPCGAASAQQAYPTRLITLVVPFPAGGPTDIVARVLAESMRTTLEQPVIVENVSGAGGSIGVGRVARAPADGYTLIVGQISTHVFNGATHNLPYKVLEDFEPISLVANTAVWLVTRKSLPTGSSLQELISWLRANPGVASASSVGPAGLGAIAAYYFQERTGTQFQIIPYRGGAPATQDLVAERIDLSFDQAANSLAQVRSGTAKAVAVLGPERWRVEPGVPTVDELGLPGLHMSYWHGIWAPRDTPREVVDKLSAAVQRALSDDSVRRRLLELGQEPPPLDQQGPRALARHQKSEIEKWWPIIKAANIKAE